MLKASSKRTETRADEKKLHIFRYKKEKKEHNLITIFPYPHPAIINRRLDSASKSVISKPRRMLIYDQLEPFWSSLASHHLMSFRTTTP
jgi:hypothetical protein